MRIEIKNSISLQPGDSKLLDMHSLYNVINILAGELQILDMLAQDREEMTECVSMCLKVKKDLSSTDKVLSFAENIDAFMDSIIKAAQDLLSRHPHLTDTPEATESLENINSVLVILKVRATEILERHKHPHQWKEHDLSSLTQNFLDVFAAIEKNSKGRYSFVFNLAAQKDVDYYIDIRFESVDGQAINMPPVFQDVMRDLMANARKYTDPGGRISAGLLDDGKNLRFCVEDTGIGIPSADIEKVVEFGFRASNVAERRTMGGGFGLTKAYVVTRQFNGRMWIDSKEGQGTRITIIIPRQASQARDSS